MLLALLAMRAASEGQEPTGGLLIGAIVGAVSFCAVWAVTPGGVTEAREVMRNVRSIVTKEDPPTRAPSVLGLGVEP